MAKRVRRRARTRGGLKEKFEILLGARVHDELFDPFHIIGKQRRNKAYQWVALSVLGDPTPVQSSLDALKQAGWRPVPARWHPKMPNRAGRIEYGGQLLCWRDIKSTETAAKLDSDKAEQMLPHALRTVHELYGFVGYVGNLKIGGGLSNSQNWPELKTSFKVPTDFDARLVAAKAQTRWAHGVQCVDIPIGFPISDREVEIAVHLNLDPVEYIRRLVIMHKAESGEPNVLVEVVPGVYRFAEIKLEK